ncbi:MAG: cation:proton antiporter [Candidatus Eiseniibacteriota bacterium]
MPRLSRALLVPALFATIAASLLVSPPARAAAEPGAVDMLSILAGLVLILVGARLGGAFFESFGQPAVLGELLAGIALGNLGLLGVHALDPLRSDVGISILAQIGVLFLLFQVGLESDVQKMMAVGASSFVVALLGVVTPMILGSFVSSWFFPTHHVLTHWFVGATLTATSVGITARVLADLGRTASKEGRIILGAAVIDDVMGLIVLAVVAGIIEAANRGAAFQPATVIWIVGKSLLFLVGAVVVGRWLSRHGFQLATRLRGEGVLLSVALVFCFGLAFLAGRAGLAPIVGAFAAGLVLDEVHFEELRARHRERRSLRELLQPLATFLVPVFFVLMGIRVDLGAFGQAEVLGFAAVLTLAAVLGKQVCSLGVLEKDCDRLAVGLGMIPRGEVGLIFAGIGATLTIGDEPVVDGAVFSAVVVMVALTTLVTPPLLVWRLRKRGAKGKTAGA